VVTAAASGGGRVFAPNWRWTLVALLLAAAFARLGVWQWQRGEQREASAARFARGADAMLELGTRAPEELPLYQRVAVAGVLDGTRQFLLDNRIFEGRAGYEVLTPLARAGGAVILIDRGWVPFSGSRARLPDVSLPSGPARLTGRIATLPAPGLALGRAPPQGAWPKVTSYPDTVQLGNALGTPVAARIVLLDPAAPFGYVRVWQLPGLPPLRHFSYAVQWWSFALLTLVIWVVVSRRPLAQAVRS
jgi:surfeit locus 1 family protein